MLKEYLEDRKRRWKTKQYNSGFDYVCGVLIREEKSVEELASEINLSDCTDAVQFDFGMRDAIDKLTELGLV